MKEELKRPKICLGLLVTLALALSAVMGVPALAQPSFAGDVEADFTGSDVLIFTDPGILGVPDPELEPPWTHNGSGWDIKDLRLAYDPATDILYVGINSHHMVGDADNDGNEATMSNYVEGVDQPNLSGSECVSVYFDLDQDGTYDVIAGVPAGITGNPAKDISDFSVNVYLADHLYFGAQLPTHTGTVYWDPTLTIGTGDFEFTIRDFKLLPGQDDELGAFNVGAFMGSQDDDGIGEDFLSGSTSPAINVIKKTNGTDNNSGPGPYIAVNGAVSWTYEVTNTGSENLTNIVVTDDNGTPGNTGDDFNPSPVDISPSDGFNDGDTDKDNELDLTETWLYQASGSATVGSYSNTATATGYSYGLPVSDTDPDHYTGVDVRISISPLEDDNEVDTNHVLTILLQKSVAAGVWTPLDGETVTASLSNSAGATAVFVGSNSGTTSASGQFSVTIKSLTPGSTAVWADWAGGTVEGAVITARMTNPDADKDWVDVRISISPLEGDNKVDTNHVLTILLQKSVAAGVWTPLDGETVTASLSNSAGATAVFVGSNSGSTNSSGQFAVTIKSPTPGSTTIWADWLGGTVEGAVITTKTTDPDASKDWMAACIHIEKTTNGEDADSEPGPCIPVGGPVIWVYNVTNCGDVPLSSINVTDSEAGVIPAYVSGDTSNIGFLDLSESWLYQATGSATLGQYSNIGNVTGTTPEQYLVSDSDPSHYLGVKARIEISPLSDSNRLGEEHFLTACVYVDTGSGYTLYPQPITINFSKVGVGNLSAASVPTSTGCAQTILTSNVTGSSTITAHCAFPVGGVGGASFNISTDGTGDNGGPAQKTWEAQACIHIEKTTNGIDGPPIPVGDPVIWVYTVTNRGDVPLSSINVTDSDAGVIPLYQYGDDNSNNLLDLTEAWIYQATGTATAGYYTNVGYVTGTTPEQNLVSYSDPSHYYGRPTVVGWETYPVDKVRVLLPWIGLLAGTIAGASLLVLSRRRMRQKS